MKIYIKSSLSMPSDLRYIVEDIMFAIDEGKKVYIEYGSLNDRLISYNKIKSKDPVGEDTVLFNTTGATTYFGNKIDLSAFSKVDYQDEGNILYVEVEP